MVVALGQLGPANAEDVKIERFEKTGYVELNGVRYFNNFFAKGEIHYVESEFVWGITSKVIKAVYITDYKFCNPGVESRVKWISTGSKLKLRKVDSEYRFTRNVPLFTTNIIGQQVWLEFRNFLD